MGKEKTKTSFRKSFCRSGSGAADVVARNEIGNSPFSIKSKNPCSFLWRLQAPGAPTQKVAGGALRTSPTLPWQFTGPPATGEGPSEAPGPRKYKPPKCV